MARLLRDQGLAISMPELLALLTADCPRRADPSVAEPARQSARKRDPLSASNRDPSGPFVLRC